MTLLLISPVVLFLYETYQVFICGEISPQKEEQLFIFIRRILSEGGHSTLPVRQAANQPFNPQRGRHSFFPTGFL